MPTANARIRAAQAACPVIRQFSWPRTEAVVRGAILEDAKDNGRKRRNAIAGR
ncbi:MAG TPA: hypothetical protein VKD04_05715 [Burkholderiales bacterium]|nr:hypothetical protein [Burkholderiales bacterium]